MKPIKISKNKLDKTVEDLRIGETAWIKYEAMWVDFNKDLYVQLYAITKPKRTPKMGDEEGYLLEIKRVEEGVVAYYGGKHHKWVYDYADPLGSFNEVGDSLIVVAKTEIEYKRKKKNPSLDDLEDQIHQKSFELAEIENGFNEDPMKGGLSGTELVAQIKKQKQEIAILVAKREKILKRKKS